MTLAEVCVGLRFLHYLVKGNFMRTLTVQYFMINCTI